MVMASPSREAFPPLSARQPNARREVQNTLRSREDNLVNGRTSRNNRGLSGLLEAAGDGGDLRNNGQLLEDSGTPTESFVSQSVKQSQLEVPANVRTVPLHLETPQQLRGSSYNDATARRELQSHVVQMLVPRAPIAKVAHKDGEGWTPPEPLGTEKNSRGHPQLSMVNTARIQMKREQEYHLGDVKLIEDHSVPSTDCPFLGQVMDRAQPWANVNTEEGNTVDSEGGSMGQKVRQQHGQKGESQAEPDQPPLDQPSDTANQQRRAATIEHLTEKINEELQGMNWVTPHRNREQILSEILHTEG
eukprot:c6684_g1_i1 orf=219-1130(-)